MKTFLRKNLSKNNSWKVNMLPAVARLCHTLGHATACQGVQAWKWGVQRLILEGKTWGGPGFQLESNWEPNEMKDNLGWWGRKGVGNTLRKVSVRAAVIFANDSVGKG